MDERLEILKTDALGRVQTTREQRELLLDEFDRSGVSGPKFVGVVKLASQNLGKRRKIDLMVTIADGR